MRRIAANLLQPLAHSRVQIGERQLERRSVAGCSRENPDDDSVERERVAGRDRSARPVIRWHPRLRHGSPVAWRPVRVDRQGSSSLPEIAASAHRVAWPCLSLPHLINPRSRAAVTRSPATGRRRARSVAGVFDHDGERDSAVSVAAVRGKARKPGMRLVVGDLGGPGLAGDRRGVGGQHTPRSGCHDLAHVARQQRGVGRCQQLRVFHLDGRARRRSSALAARALAAQWRPPLEPSSPARRRPDPVHSRPARASVATRQRSAADTDRFETATRHPAAPADRVEAQVARNTHCTTPRGRGADPPTRAATSSIGSSRTGRVDPAT